MPELSRHICTGCGQSIYNAMINGVRVPLVAQITVGQPNDTGPLLNINDATVAVPSVVRELAMTPVSRIELCMNCFASWIGQPLVTVEQDPMHDAGASPLADLPTLPGVMSESERFALMHERTLYAARVAQGVSPAPAGQQCLRRHAEHEAYLAPTPVPSPALPSPQRRSTPDVAGS